MAKMGFLIISTVEISDEFETKLANLGQNPHIL